MPQTKHDWLRGMVRLLLRFVIVIAAFLAVIGLATYALNQVWGPPATERELENSARTYADELATELDSSLSDQQIIAVAKRHGTYPLEVRRGPEVTTMFALVPGAAPDVPHVVRAELCFRFELHPEPRDTVVRREDRDRCPPLAPSLRPTPTT